MHSTIRRMMQGNTKRSPKAISGWLGPLLLLCVCALCAQAQLGTGIIRSISTYAQCSSSPLNGQGIVVDNPDASGSAGNSPCSYFNQSQPILAIRVRLSPLLGAGVQNLLLRIPSVPPVGETYEFGDSGAEGLFGCQGVPIGQPCRIPSRPLLLTFSTSDAFAAYDMTKRPDPIPSCYFQATATQWRTVCEQENTCALFDDVVTNAQYQGLPFYGAKASCGTLGSIGGFGQTSPDLPGSYGGEVSSLASACPQPDALPPAYQPFFDPPAQQSGDQFCPWTYCRIPGEGGEEDSWTMSWVQSLDPLCSVSDINPKPRTVMGAEMFLALGSYEDSDDVETLERLQISTDMGELPRLSRNVPVALQLIGINKPLGIIANPLPNTAIVTCNGGGPDNRLALDDMPGLVPPTDPSRTIQQQYYVPWRTANPVDGVSGATGRAKAQRCTLPVWACRKLFLPDWYLQSVGDAAVNASIASVLGNWYVVTMQRMPEYEGRGCNKNGIDLSLLSSQRGLLQRRCAAQALSLSGDAAECVPGYKQRDQRYRTATPTDVSIFYSYYLSTLGANTQRTTSAAIMPPLLPSSVPALDFVPADYVPLDPQYWVSIGPSGPRFMRTAQGGAGVSMDAVVYIAEAEFMGQITSISVGKFVQSSMTCSATTSGGGVTSYTTTNLSPLPGQFLVAVTPILPPGGQPAELQIFLTQQKINTGTESLNVTYQLGQWGLQLNANGTVQQSFDFVYTGPLRNSIQMQLQLYIPAGVQGGWVLVDQVTSSCAITMGVVSDLAGKGREGDEDFVVSLKNYHVCIYWYQNLFYCFGHYDKRWKLVVNLIVTVLTLLMALLLAVSGVVACVLVHIRGEEVVKIASSEVATPDKDNGTPAS